MSDSIHTLPRTTGRPPRATPRGGPLRKAVMVVAIGLCLIMSVVGGLLPILQGWIFFVIALYLLATEFETGRRWVRVMRRRWPGLSRLIADASTHRWAPRKLKEFEELTDPARPDRT